jgi:hypothetical protein
MHGTPNRSLLARPKLNKISFRLLAVNVSCFDFDCFFAFSMRIGFSFYFYLVESNARTLTVD